MDKIIRRYALENAVKYDGKANLNAVIGHVFSKVKIKDKAKIIEKVKKIVKEINSLDKEKQKNQYKSLGVVRKKKVVKKGLPILPNAKKVVMRVAPYPSGPLHIGNARPFVLNDEYAKKYRGKLLLVIDDTIGSEEKNISKDAYKLIPEGLKWLGVKFSRTVYKSDRLKIYYKYAEELIKMYKAYVCFCKAEKLRENRAKGVECECRHRGVEDNLKEWKNMLKKYGEGRAVLRLKTDMQDPNPAFRDRVMFRISKRKHPRVGGKYKVWPLLEFSWAVDDHLLGITHIIRGKELMMESQVENYIWKLFGWDKPVIIHTGLLQLQGVKLSKSKSKKEVESKKYTGWDDPRTWSLQSLKRRGILPEAVRKFVLSFGLTQTEITVPVENLYMENRKLIDKKSNRYFFIWNPKKIKIKDAPKVVAKVPMHPDFKGRGRRSIKTNGEFYICDELNPKKYYRFMHLFNFKDKEFASMNYDPKMKLIMIHWLPVSKDLVNVEVLLENGKGVKGLGESALKKLKIGDVVQFERFSFVKLEKKSKDKLNFIWVHR